MNEKIKNELFMIYVLGSKKLAKAFINFHKLDEDYEKTLNFFISQWKNGDRKIIVQDAVDIFEKVNRFIYPVNPLLSVLTDFYGNTDGRAYAHGGIDIAAKEGTPILAGADGVIMESRNVRERKDWKKVYGNYLIIEHWNVNIWFCHCDELNVKAGEIVAKGQQIATVGNTGGSSGSHLHMATWELEAKKHRNPLNK